MSFFGKNPDVAKMKERIERAELAYAFVTQGWEVGPAGASNGECTAELVRYLKGDQANWYPPEYEETPLVDDGKLKVNPEPKPKWKLW
jgi:hypothetical protein